MFFIFIQCVFKSYVKLSESHCEAFGERFSFPERMYFAFPGFTLFVCFPSFHCHHRQHQERHHSHPCPLLLSIHPETETALLEETPSFFTRFKCYWTVILDGMCLRKAIVVPRLVRPEVKSLGNFHLSSCYFHRAGFKYQHFDCLALPLHCQS